MTEFRNKYYDIQNENDKLTEHIESLSEMNNHNVKLNQQNLAKLKADIKTNNEEHENELHKFETDKRISEEKFAKISKKLEIAENVINDLKEKVDEKDIEISNLQHSKTSAKFTSETQTSLADELNEVAQLKITNKKKALLEKFSEVQTKINLQINVLTKSVQSLKSKSPERCAYGWKCKRKFCKYSHEYLYSGRSESTMQFIIILSYIIINIHLFNCLNIIK